MKTSRASRDTYTHTAGARPSAAGGAAVELVELLSGVGGVSSWMEFVRLRADRQSKSLPVRSVSPNPITTNKTLLTRRSVIGSSIWHKPCYLKTRALRSRELPALKSAPVTATHPALESLPPISFARSYAASKAAHSSRLLCLEAQRNGGATCSTKAKWAERFLSRLSEFSSCRGTAPSTAGSRCYRADNVLQARPLHRPNRPPVVGKAVDYVPPPARQFSSNGARICVHPHTAAAEQVSRPARAVRSTPTDTYNPQDDFQRSIDEAYRVIRERVKNGGRGWTQREVSQ